MRGKNRNSIEEREKLPQFTTMHVIDGQADIVNYASLIFYSLTINNILNIIVMLILVGVTVNIAINGDLFGTASKAGLETQKAAEQEELSMAALSAINDEALEVGYIDVNVLEAKINELETEYIKDTTKTTDYNYVVTSSKTGTTWQISLITAKVTEYNEGGNPWL